MTTKILKYIASNRFVESHPQPLIGDLSMERVTRSRLFSNVDIDFAGAFFMKKHELCKAREYKVYLRML